MIGAADLASGEIRGSVDRAVCFADLVEFTRLGEEIAPEELGSVAGRLEEMAATVAEPPVRLVKMIGDAAMFVSREAEPMLDAALELIEAAEAEGEEFPFCAPASPSARRSPSRATTTAAPVNLASRITGVARPGSVLVDAAAKEAAGEDFAYSFAGERKLKGIDSRRQALPRPARAERALGGLARRDQQVVEELGRQVRLEQAGVDLLQGHVAAEGEVAPAPGDRSGSALDSTVRRPQPQALASSSSPPTRRSSKPASRSSRRRSAGAKAWTSTSPSSAWPSDCSASAIGRRAGADERAARPARRAAPARLGSAARRSP